MSTPTSQMKNSKARVLKMPHKTLPPRHQDGQQVSTGVGGAGEYLWLSRSPVAEKSHYEYFACVTKYYDFELILVTNRPLCIIDQHKCGITTKENEEATGEKKSKIIRPCIYCLLRKRMNEERKRKTEDDTELLGLCCL